MWEKIKHIFAMWIWKNNDFTGCVDQIEEVIEDIRDGYADIMHLKWRFKRTDPNATYDIIVRKAEKP